MTRPAALFRAAHPGPTVAVTVVAALLALGAGLSAGRTALVVSAVLSGQLSIGWSNDLVDAARDRSVGRADKPVATGEITVTVVRSATLLAVLATVCLSLAAGLGAGLAHLVLVVGSGWVYNVHLKSTLWSWLPYVVAFGSLPAVVGLAATPPMPPVAWMVAAGALLGVGGHLVNALPDFADDARTGVHGLPHRLGPRLTPPAATAALVAASAMVVLGPSSIPGAAAWVGLAAVAALAVVALRGRGRTPFRAAVAIALVDVLMLAAVGGSRT